MKKPWPPLAFIVPILLWGCGGSVSVPPPPPTITVPGLPPVPGPGPDPAPEPDPGTIPVSSLNGQMWTSTGTTGPQWRVLVLEDLGFMGWWIETPDTGPPVYGVVGGSMTADNGAGRWSTSDMTATRLPSGQQTVATMTMTEPRAGVTQATFETQETSLRAEARAHESLSMDQRSGRYAGELQLPGHREPVSLQWNTDGSLALSMTRLTSSVCQATGAATSMSGAPARLLEFTLAFSGAGCPQVGTGFGNVPILLEGMTVRGVIDASSADAFVLFGRNDATLTSLLLPAARVPALSLQGAWSGIRSADQVSFHFALLNDFSL